jgi:hypothetical protein
MLEESSECGKIWQIILQLVEIVRNNFSVLFKTVSTGLYFPKHHQMENN